jgi:EPS-associated MarR family transcriptional regulator
MNNFEQEVHYHLLKALSNDGNLTQRQMAREMGVSLGKVNFCLSKLIQKGFIKVKRFKGSNKKRKYIYVLTPRGLEEKAHITMNFLQRKMREYEEIKRQIRQLTREVEQENPAGMSALDPADP